MNTSGSNPVTAWINPGNYTESAEYTQAEDSLVFTNNGTFTLEGPDAPVLVVRRSAPLTRWARGERPLRVLVGADFSGTARAAIAWLSELRRIGPAEVARHRDAADAQAHRLAGELERRAGRIPDALGHFRRAAALDSADRESRQLVAVLEAGGQVARESVLARVLADDTFATMSFGTICLEQGLVDEAAQIFLRILGKEPGHPAARAKLEDALRGKTQKRKGS